MRIKYNYANKLNSYLPFFLFLLISFNSKENYAQLNSELQIENLIEKSENIQYTNIDSSKMYLDSALTLALQFNYKLGIAKAKRQKAVLKYFEVRFTDALNLSIESYNLFKAIGDTGGQAAALNLTAVIYNDQGKGHEALRIYDQILELIGDENIQRRASTYNNIGVTYRGLGDIEKCYEYYLRGFKTIQNKGELEDESQYSNNLGYIFIKRGYPDSAFYYTNYGLNLALKINNNHRISNSYETLADYYYWQKDFDSALKYYLLAFEYAKKIEIVYEISSTASGLSKTYAALGNFAKAYEYLQIQKMMDDSVKQKETASYITQIELEKDFQKERDLNEAINEKNRLIKNIYIIVIFAILLIAGILLFNFYQKKKAYAQLEAYSKQLLSQKLEIERQADELTKLSSLKDKLFSIISHDLRSPLISLVSILNLAKQNKFSQEEYSGLLNETLENVSYTTAMVDNLLNWASSQQEGMKIKPSNLILNEQVQSQVLNFNNQLHQKNIKITNNIEKDLVVFADEDMLRIVIRNLISNAVKFSKEDSEIIISAEKTSKNIQMKVQDFGIGMSNKIKTKLFHTILDSTRGTNNEKGTGLGLKLCKDFIRLNGGSISVESEEEKGSTFIITIPKGK